MIAKMGKASKTKRKGGVALRFGASRYSPYGRDTTRITDLCDMLSTTVASIKQAPTMDDGDEQDQVPAVPEGGEDSEEEKESLPTRGKISQRHKRFVSLGCSLIASTRKRRRCACAVHVHQGYACSGRSSLWSKDARGYPLFLQSFVCYPFPAPFLSLVHAEDRDDFLSAFSTGSAREHEAIVSTGSVRLTHIFHLSISIFKPGAKRVNLSEYDGLCARPGNGRS